MSNRFVQYKPLGYKPVTLPLELIKETLTERRKLIDVMDEAQDQLALIRATPIPGTGYEREAAEENRDLQNLKETTTRYFQDNPTDLYGQKRLIREVKNNITNRMLTGRLGAINNAYTSYAKQMEELQKDAGKKDGFSHTRINEAAELFKFKHQNLGKFDPTTGRYENATSLQNPAYNYDINEQLDAAIKNTPAMKDYTVHKSRDGFTVINTITGKESKEGLQIVKNLYDRLLGDSKYKEDLSWQAQIWAMRNNVTDPQKISQYMQAKSQMDAQAGMGYGYTSEEKPTISTYKDDMGILNYKFQLAQLLNQEQPYDDNQQMTYGMASEAPTSVMSSIGNVISQNDGFLGTLALNMAPYGTTVLGNQYAAEREKAEKAKANQGIDAITGLPFNPQHSMVGNPIGDKDRAIRLTEIALSNPQYEVTIIDGATGRPKKMGKESNVRAFLADHESEIRNPTTGKLKRYATVITNPTIGAPKIGIGIPFNSNGDMAIIQPSIAINNLDNPVIKNYNQFVEANEHANNQQIVLAHRADTNLFRDSEIPQNKIPEGAEGFRLTAVKNVLREREKIAKYKVEALVRNSKGGEPLWYTIPGTSSGVELPNLGVVLDQDSQKTKRTMFAKQYTVKRTHKNPFEIFGDDDTN